MIMTLYSSFQCSLQFTCVHVHGQTRGNYETGCTFKLGFVILIFLYFPCFLNDNVDNYTLLLQYDAACKGI